MPGDIEKISAFEIRIALRLSGINGRGIHFGMDAGRGRVSRVIANRTVQLTEMAPHGKLRCRVRLVDLPFLPGCDHAAGNCGDSENKSVHKNSKMRTSVLRLP